MSDTLKYNALLDLIKKRQAMNRYTVETNDPYDMTPDAGGIWVPYDEAAAAIAELVGALRDAVNMVEYLHRKFKETGSGNGFVAQWEYMIAKHQQPTTTEKES